MSDAHLVIEEVVTTHIGWDEDLKNPGTFNRYHKDDDGWTVKVLRGAFTSLEEAEELCRTLETVREEVFAEGEEGHLGPVKKTVVKSFSVFTIMLGAQLWSSGGYHDSQNYSVFDPPPRT